MPTNSEILHALQESHFTLYGEYMTSPGYGWMSPKREAEETILPVISKAVRYAHEKSGSLWGPSGTRGPVKRIYTESQTEGILDALSEIMARKRGSLVKQVGLNNEVINLARLIIFDLLGYESNHL
jgi:hypothetical protein